ncbi:hypothetical protein M2347_001935 [Chryseobacterium sp. H1D6B]|uniref:hypothetical protein n=1 Tax=Chryseobacterium sp. H1D6B TaxID=2940588 RepID=UPI0015CB6938|nr:hypothetical protein [Chryseobacterium sp. H1D6B]MDH6252208.1 hypothetical protein [Chryseobacterium sp. H1D6B]
MKNLILAASVTMFSIAGLSAKSTTPENVTVKKVTIMKKISLTKCYRKAVDAFGNVYYAEVKCPDKLIIVSPSITDLNP